jgi:MerR family transcriptional regulator, copper efflux regulator
MTDPPIACSLNSEQVPARRAALVELVEQGLITAEQDGPVGRLSFRADERTLAQVDEFLRTEKDCCPFFDFRVTPDAGVIQVEVRVPEGAEPMVAGLVEAFRDPRTARLPIASSA